MSDPLPPPSTDDNLEALPLETIFDRLNHVVEQLERGDLPLEKALAMFEQGVKLTREGQRRLEQAEQRIEALTSTAPGNDPPRTRPVQPGR